MGIRERLVELALSYENVGPGTNRAKYVSLLQSAEPADHSGQAAAYFAAPLTSGCALTVRGLWRAAGLDHPLLGAYYVPGRIGHAVEDCLKIGRQFGGLVSGAALARLPDTVGSYVPQPGDMGYVGGPEHVFTVIEVTPTADGYELTTIDGGQVVNGQQMITRRHRTWKRSATSLADLPKFGGLPKTVLGLVDVSKLPFPVPASVPPPCPMAAA